MQGCRYGYTTLDNFNEDTPIGEMGRGQEMWSERKKTKPNTYTTAHRCGDNEGVRRLRRVKWQSKRPKEKHGAFRWCMTAHMHKHNHHY